MEFDETKNGEAFFQKIPTHPDEASSKPLETPTNTGSNTSNNQSLNDCSNSNSSSSDTTIASEPTTTTPVSEAVSPIPTTTNSLLHQPPTSPTLNNRQQQHHHHQADDGIRVRPIDDGDDDSSRFPRPFSPSYCDMHGSNSQRDESIGDPQGCRVLLLHRPVWRCLYKQTNEMILNTNGRRMFPTISFEVRGLKLNETYDIVLRFEFADTCRWKYKDDMWIPSNSTCTSTFVVEYRHPRSPCTGLQWMSSCVAFDSLRIANTDRNDETLKHLKRHFNPSVSNARRVRNNNNNSNNDEAQCACEPAEWKRNEGLPRCYSSAEDGSPLTTSFLSKNHTTPLGGITTKHLPTYYMSIPGQSTTPQKDGLQILCAPPTKGGPTTKLGILRPLDATTANSRAPLIPPQSLAPPPPLTPRSTPATAFYPGFDPWTLQRHRYYRQPPFSDRKLPLGLQQQPLSSNITAASSTPSHLQEVSPVETFLATESVANFLQGGGVNGMHNASPSSVPPSLLRTEHPTMPVYPPSASLFSRRFPHFPPSLDFTRYKHVPAAVAPSPVMPLAGVSVPSTSTLGDLTKLKLPSFGNAFKQNTFHPNSVENQRILRNVLRSEMQQAMCMEDARFGPHARFPPKHLMAPGHLGCSPDEAISAGLIQPPKWWEFLNAPNRSTIDDEADAGGGSSTT